MYGYGYMSPLFPNRHVLLDVGRRGPPLFDVGQGIPVRLSYEKVYGNRLGYVNYLEIDFTFIW